MRKPICGLTSLSNARAVSIAAQDGSIDKQVAKARPSVLREGNRIDTIQIVHLMRVLISLKLAVLPRTKFETTSPEDDRKSRRFRRIS